MVYNITGTKETQQKVYCTLFQGPTCGIIPYQKVRALMWVQLWLFCFQILHSGFACVTRNVLVYFVVVFLSLFLSLPPPPSQLFQIQICNVINIKFHFLLQIQTQVKNLQSTWSAVWFFIKGNPAHLLWTSCSSELIPVSSQNYCAL